MPDRAPRRRLLPWLSLFVVWVVWGSTYLAMRIVVREMPPLPAAATRFLCAGAIMGLVALVVDRRHGWPTRRQWLDYALIGVLLLSVGNSLVMWAEQTVPSGIAALIVATVPLWILLFGSLVGFTAFAYCLNELPATTVGTYAYVNPMVAVVLGAVVLGESLTSGLLAGGLLIVLSVALTTLRKHG
jgi:drug/metabolite transporter (DMT)-like permease